MVQEKKDKSDLAAAALGLGSLTDNKKAWLKMAQ